MADNPGTAIQRSAMRRIVWTQSFGITADATLVNGTLLLYLTAIGVDAARTMVYLSIHPMTAAVLLLPCAYLADRYGKKAIGQTGLTLGVFGWGLVAFAGFSEAHSHVLAGAGILLAAISFSMLAAGWFSLLSPIIPTEIRGRFFARLRTIFSIVSVILSLIYAGILAHNSGIAIYQGIFLIGMLAYLARWFSYRGIPELEPPAGRAHHSFFKAVGDVLRIRPLIRFCNYSFLLILFTAGAAALFAMTEKRVVGLTDGQVLLLANITIVGSIAGMLVGGRVIDRSGPRLVFAGCHIGFAAGLFAFVLRVLLPEGMPQLIYLGLLHFVLGAGRGAIGIALTTELMALLPEKNKSVAASAFSIFQTSGLALSGFLSAGLLKSGFLEETWEVADRTFSEFDSILIGFGFMTLILIPTLALVPSMRRKSESASLGLNRL